MTRHSAFLRRVCGCLLIGAGVFAAYWWSYKLAPVRRLADPEWRAAHSARARWQEEQKKYIRLSASPDLCFAGDMIGYYGDKEWCLWLIDMMHGGGHFRVCGCTETALMMMANRHGKGVSPIIYNYFSPVPAAGEAFETDAFVLAWDKGSMAGNLVACVLLS